MEGIREFEKTGYPDFHGRTSRYLWCRHPDRGRAHSRINISVKGEKNIQESYINDIKKLIDRNGLFNKIAVSMISLFMEMSVKVAENLGFFYPAARLERIEHSLRRNVSRR